MNSLNTPKKFWAVSFALAFALLIAGFAVSGNVAAGEGDGIDHSLFPQLAGPFENPQEVTVACLECHADSATQVMATVHWTWEYTDPVTGQELGNNNVVITIVLPCHPTNLAAQAAM